MKKAVVRYANGEKSEFVFVKMSGGADGMVFALADDGSLFVYTRNVNETYGMLLFMAVLLEGNR
jgi:hypothetical protein